MKLKLLILLVLAISALNAQWYTDDPFSGHYLSAEEYLNANTYSRDFYETEPPDGNPRNVAEFEQMQAVIIRYPFGIPYELIAAMSQEINVITIVANQSQENSVISSYNSNGVNTANCEFLHAPSDSYWSRDYGPWFATYGNNEIGIVNFDYNRPRPNDNDIPIEVADYLGIELFGMNVIHTGGNYMTDGLGISASTTIVYTESAGEGISQTQVDQRMNDYLGIEEYHVVADPNGEYIDHIDCWGKFLDVDKLLLRSVPSSHSQYDEVEATVAYFEQQTSSYGTPYQIYRVYTPQNQPYTNSLILNDRVFVPLTSSQWDDDAIATYEEAMPGYDVVGIEYGGWMSTDALHCRAKGIADLEMLYIEHIPYAEFAPAGQEIPITAKVIPYSGMELSAGFPKIFYNVNGGEFNSIQLISTGNDNFSGNIPIQSVGTEIEYYIVAQDESGKTSNNPLIGESDPHYVICGGPTIELSQDYFEIDVEQGTLFETDLEIINSGSEDLEYSITLSAGTRDDFSYDIPDSPADVSSYDYNTFEEVGWTEFDVTDEGLINNWSISYSWDTDQYDYEGSFHVLSSAGTSYVIASGNSDGNYEVFSDSFSGEELSGTWRIWIEDTYGDGGHRATNISVNVSTLSPEESWLSVDPLSGIIAPGNSEMMDISCDATELSLGDYFGSVSVTSNDPANPVSVVDIDLHVVPDVEAENGVNGIVTSLKQNHPNPFNPITTISFNLSDEDAEDAKIEIYNIKGRKVDEIAINKKQTTVSWNAENFSSGIYFYKLSTKNYTKTMKMVLLK